MSTNFKDIQFNAEYHTYTLNGQRLNNVSRAIKEFQIPFDRDGIARDAKGEAGRALGTRVHQYIQNTLLGNIGQSDPFLSLNGLLPEEKTFNQLWANLEGVIIKPDHVEMVIGDSRLGIAGTLDSLLLNTDTGLHHVWDFKTGKFDIDNPWQNLLPPFDDLSDCKLNMYSLQVSLYRLILQRNTALKLGDSYIVHLSKMGYKIHKALDLTERLACHYGVK